jgi:hypothetical protein
MRKIWITGFFFENRLHWQYEGEKISTNCCCRLHIYLCVNKTLIHNSLYVFNNWGKNLSHKKMYNYSQKIKVFTPTDAQVFKRSIKIYLQTAPTCFGVITIIR